MYDTIAGASGMFKSYYLSKDKTQHVFPTINPNMITCSMVYYDGQMNDARLNVAVALTAASHGATIVNHTEVLSLLKSPNPYRASATTLDATTTAPSSESAKPKTVLASPAEPPYVTPIPPPAPTSTTPSYTPQPLPPISPSPPPNLSPPDLPVEKLIEKVKTFIMGSDKNKKTEDSRITSDHVVTGAVVRDSILCNYVQKEIV